MIRFITTDQASFQSGVKILVYAPAGHGKTWLCKTAPNPFIVSAEGGLLTLRKERLPGAEVRSVPELQEVYNWIIGSAEARQYWTICWDSISETAEVLLANLMKTVGSKDPRKAFGEVVPRMAELVRQFRDIPNKHVYISAKMEPVKDDMSGVISNYPSMPGKKLGPQLPHFFDEVFFLGVEKDANGNLWRYLQTQPDIQHVAKDRSNVLNPKEEPDLGKLFNKILNS